MAKVAFSKFNLKQNNSVITIKFNDIDIEIKQYLPIEKKLDLLTNVLNYSMTDKGFYNEGKIRISYTLEVIYAYTNITFTDKQKEDICKLYDLVVSSGLATEVFRAIRSSEKEMLEECLDKVIKSVYSYQNSVMGIIDALGNNYDALDMDAKKLQEEIGNPENLGLLREVLTKLG